MESVSIYALLSVMGSPSDGESHDGAGLETLVDD